MAPNEEADREPLLSADTDESDEFRAKLIPLHSHGPPKRSKYRLVILLWLSVQTTFHSLLLIHSRSRPDVDVYLPSVAVFFTEVIKVVACLTIVKFTDRENGLCASLHHHILLNVHGVLHMSVPAILYTFQTNLLYIAASHLDPASFMLKIFSSAVSSMFLLGRRLSGGQWVALVLLFIGICIVQTSRMGSTSPGHNNQSDPLVGFVSVAVAAGTSGFSGVYMERQLKSAEPVSIWMRNVQMGLVAVPAAFGTVLLQNGADLLEGRLSPLRGFDWITWLTVCSASLGGLSVAACIKFADNIAKDFASASAIVLTTLGSTVLFHFQPTALFALGALFVMSATYLFSRCAVKKVVPKLEPQPKMVLREDAAG